MNRRGSDKSILAPRRIIPLHNNRATIVHTRSSWLRLAYRILLDTWFGEIFGSSVVFRNVTVLEEAVREAVGTVMAKGSRNR